jgi:Trypsin
MIIPAYTGSRSLRRRPPPREPQMRRNHNCHTSIQKAVCGALLFFSLLTGFDQPACAISNGQSVRDDDPIRPVMVSLYGDDDDCTGVKIAANLILTARHCLPNKSTRAFFPDGSAYKIVQSFVPDAQRTSRKNQYDFAILVIAGNVPGPVALVADEAPENGSIGWTAGYGGQKLTVTTNPLRKLAVAMVEKNYSPSAATVRALQGGAVCDGDSGGPGYTQVGGKIVVWGLNSGPVSGKSRCSSREVYANVTSRRDWIREIIMGNHGIAESLTAPGKEVSARSDLSGVGLHPHP